MTITIPSLTSIKVSDKQKALAPRIGLALLFVALLASAGFFYWRYREEVRSNPRYEVEQITRELRKVMDLPADSQPTLATVTEKEKLQGQGFFKNAENGDKVLIYLDIGKAILYRPSTKKIIDVAPVQETAAPSASPAASESQSENVVKPLRVAVLNGTTITGLTKLVERKLDELPLNLSVEQRANAARVDYQTTLVVDLKGDYAAQAQQLAQLLSGKVSGLPEGERSTDSDLLVIAGSETVTAPPSPSPSPSDANQP